MKSIVDQSHDFLKDALHKGAICIDATLGWGKDTNFFLKNKVNLVLRNKKNICSLYKHKVKGTDIKITTRTYDKNGEGC